MTHSRSAFARAMVLLFAVSCLLPQTAGAADIIVRRDHGLTASERAELRADAGVKHVQMLSLPDAEVVSVPDGREQQALAALNADPDVVVAAPNVPVRIASTPYAASYERYFPRADADTDEDGKGDTDSDIDATEAWREGWEGTHVRIAVIDQPVDATHPDLADKPVDPAQPDLPTEKVEPPPENFVTSTTCTEPVPTADHGTQVAGLAAAWKDNAGIAGVAPLASIVPLPAIDNCGKGAIVDVLEAFAWAGKNGVPIVVGSFVTSVHDPADRKAEVDALITQYADEYEDTLFVVAAGNEGANIDEPGKAVYPCSNDAPNILCVGMTDAYDKPVCWSNVGPDSVDLFAPGQFTKYGRGVVTTVHGGILQRSGTSMAAPLVAGAAALLREQHPSQGAALLTQALVAGADEFAPYLGTSTVRLKRLNATRPLLQEGAGRLGEGSVSGPWSTCDSDHDEVRFGDEDCPEQPGTPANRGCPDSDKDGRIDRVDNCPADPNPGWADTDGDGLGDACDPTRRGPDSDGDGLVDLDDACRHLYARTGNGCPAPPPPPPPLPPDPGTPGSPQPPSPTPTPVPTVKPNAGPEITSLKVSVTKSKAAKVTIRLSRTAKVSLKIELKKGRRWSRVTTKSVTASMSSKSLTLRPRGKNKQLVRGSYRVTATVAGLSKVKAFRVR